MKLERKDGFEIERKSSKVFNSDFKNINFSFKTIFIINLIDQNFYYTCA